MTDTETKSAQLSRAEGAMLGQLAGDSLGSLVEFEMEHTIRARYPNGVRELANGGTWNTLAGQPTDDSEMALVLARTLVGRSTYDADAALEVYQAWLRAEPFDCGLTIASGLQGAPNPESQANGAMMRISPLGIFGAKHPLERVAEWAREDAELTHPNPVCLEANALFTMGIAHAIEAGCSAEALYEKILGWADELEVEAALKDAVKQAADAPPENYTRFQGWVLIAFQNALWQLLHAENLEEALVDSVTRGGDTDTNGAICGALLGAVHGRGAVPSRWAEAVLSCRPAAGAPGVYQPRPEIYWPVDALDLAAALLG